jgi:hypothetical protein
MSAASRASVNANMTGILLYGQTRHDVQKAGQRFADELAALGLSPHIRTAACQYQGNEALGFQLDPVTAAAWMPDCDTTQLSKTLKLDTHRNPDDLRREILVAMLVAPAVFAFPDHDELVSAVRIRMNIVRGARRTALAFDTEHAERPEEYWTYSTERGFTLKSGRPLIEALQKTTQPDRTGKLYSFSCYRATEYVIVLAIAEELAESNPALLSALQRQWESRAIMSGQFHEVFLREYGSMADPLPPKFYVPGDRLWFRNPDEHSSNVEGYEGSWVFYMGEGLFTNFWKRDQPFTLTSKCVELYHWRHAAYFDDGGKLQVSDAIVDARVAESLADEAETQNILQRMLRWRDPGGVYQDGGCIDTTRECARYVRPAHSDIRFPD